MTHSTSKTVPSSTILLFCGLAGLVLLARADAGPTVSFALPSKYAMSLALAPAAAQASTPRFVYASGAQGVGYYASPGTTSPGPRSTFAPTVATRPRGQSVGPGVRDWTTGRRGRLHKPWLQPR